MPYLKLSLIRHAQSVGNLQRRMEGQTSTALTPLGHQQAKSLSQSLITHHASSGVSLTQDSSKHPEAAKLDATKLDADKSLSLYSSPLLRATQTADILLQTLQASCGQVPYLQMPHLQLAAEAQEMHQGILQGLTWSEAVARYPDLCHQLTQSLVLYPIPQAESPAMASARAQRWLGHLLRAHSSGGTVWIISHAGIMQYLIAHILGCDRTWKIPIRNTAIFEFWLADSFLPTAENRHNPECWLIKRFNDDSHLE